VNRTPNPSALRLEDLEAREVPAAHVSVVGHTLLVVGDNKADVVRIADNGRGTLTVDAGGTHLTAKDIRRVELFTGGGDDKVSYTLTGPLKTADRIDAFLGPGADAATFDFKAGVAAGGSLDLNLHGGKGDDKLKVDVGGVAKGGSAAVHVHGGPGKDAVYFHAVGDVGGRLVAMIDGGDGHDTQDVVSTAHQVGTGKVSIKSR
jgi:hypothetical protein